MVSMEKMKMKRKKSAQPWTVVVAAAVAVTVVLTFFALSAGGTAAAARRILVDTDMDTDDLFALLYILKQNRSEFDVKAITINANEWSDAGHGVNHLYDILYMMGRDDIPVGVGGDGGISDAGDIRPNVGGYLPLIDQGVSTAGGCRYRQAIPLGRGGRLDIDTNSGVRRGFLPQGGRRYRPLRQPTAQQVMVDTVSAGPTTVFLFGSHTNVALLLMTHPHLRRNIERLYVSGGGVRSANPTGNLFTAYATNPFAEFNIFGDPFAAYQVFHSGIPITLIPLDATNTIPVTEEFFSEFRRRQRTYEAQYCFQSLDQVLLRQRRRSNGHGNTSYYMWDSFAAGVALSSMRNGEINGGNDFAELEYINITVITSNKPYGVRDGSNPFFDGRATPKFGLKEGGVHSGHVQTGIRDSFCLVPGSNRGRCEDGYTKEVSGPEAVRIRVATSAKPNTDKNSSLDMEFFKSFLEVLNLPKNAGRFNISTQFPYYREVLYKPNFRNVNRGKPVIFDMDMSPGDFVSLIYLLKAPREVIDLKGVLVNGNGWANIASIDIVYDILHMMGRDDIPVGLGNTTALGTQTLGCNNSYAIPHGSGGFVDSDTLYGLARSLPRSPRRYTPENLDHPERRQPLAFEVWQSVRKQLDPGNKITVLTNGPLTNLVNISLHCRDASSVIERVYIVGGLIRDGGDEKGNVFTVPSNRYAEFNMFLDPLAAKTVLESNLNITLIPLTAQRKAASFGAVLEALENTPEAPSPDSTVKHFSVKCGVRGDTGPGCNAVGMIDRRVLGIQHLYTRPVYLKTEQCSINSPRNGPLPSDAPSWCEAPFDPEGLLSSLMAIVTCLIGLQIGHVIVHFKEHDYRVVQWSIPSLSLLALGFSLHLFGLQMNKSLYSLSYTCVTTGTAGLFFAAIYVLVDVYGYKRHFFPMEWMGKHALMIFVLVACNIVPILVHGFYWRQPNNNLLKLIGIGG